MPATNKISLHELHEGTRYVESVRIFHLWNYSADGLNLIVDCIQVAQDRA